MIPYTQKRIFKYLVVVIKELETSTGIYLSLSTYTMQVTYPLYSEKHSTNNKINYFMDTIKMNTVWVLIFMGFKFSWLLAIRENIL